MSDQPSSDEQPGGVSRRGLFGIALGAGVAGLVAGAGANAAVGAVLANTAAEPAAAHAFFGAHPEDLGGENDRKERQVDPVRIHEQEAQLRDDVACVDRVADDLIGPPGLQAAVGGDDAEASAEAGSEEAGETA